MDESSALLAVPNPWIKQTTASRALVLLYHRVAALERDPQLLSVTPQNFDQHLQALSNSFSVLTISELADHLTNRTLPKRSVVITFDDGYEDNLSAKAQIVSFGLSATVFVTADAVDSAVEFWWDELEQLFLEPGDLPNRLTSNVFDQLKLDGVELGTSAHYGADDAEQFHSWNVTASCDPTARHVLYRKFHDLLRFASASARQACLQALFAWAGRERRIRPSHKALSLQQLKGLAGDGIEIGSHTRTHPVLATLPKEEQWCEINDSRNFLQELLGPPIQSFAYPYGSIRDYTDESVQMVRDSGYKAAASNIADVVWPGTNPYQLPRVLVRDCDGVTFSNWVESWF